MNRLLSWRFAAAAILGVLPLTIRAEVIVEEFIGDPAAKGWQVHGESSLFRWNLERQALQVTWNSSQPNSYFHLPLGRALTESDDFRMEFEFELESVQAGVSAGRPYTFQLAAGLLNSSQAMNSGFVRGTGVNSPNLVEFNYFPDTGLGATVSPVIVSETGMFVPTFAFPFPLLAEKIYAVTLVYTAATRTLRTQVRENGEAMQAIQDVKLSAAFSGFKVDTFSISSYHEAGSGGSILAQGWVHSVTLELPDLPAPIVRIERDQDGWHIRFAGQPGWRYVVEKTESLRDWISLSEPLVADGGGEVTFTDESPEEKSAFYRVRALRH